MHEQALPVLIWGLLGRSLRGGEGSLFQGPLTMRGGCAPCGVDHGFTDTGDGPSVSAILILGLIALGLALIFEFKLGPPVWLHLLLGGLMTPVVATGLRRVLTATLTARQFEHKAALGRLAKD